MYMYTCLFSALLSILATAALASVHASTTAVLRVPTSTLYKTV